MKPHSQLRWRKQLQVAMKDQYEGEKYYQILNFDEALNSYVAMIELKGPSGSPYEGYSFLIEYAAQPQFPYSPPKVKFITIPWNPFVCPKTGKICCDILAQDWCPALVMRTVLLSLISLLQQTKLPQNQPGLNLEAAAEMRLKYSQFFKHATLMAKENNQRNQNLQKEKAKAPAEHPEDLIKQDEKFMDKKQAFMKDPKIKKKYEEKMEKLCIEKIHKQ